MKTVLINNCVGCSSPSGLRCLGFACPNNREVLMYECDWCGEYVEELVEDRYGNFVCEQCKELIEDRYNNFVCEQCLEEDE